MRQVEAIAQERAAKAGKAAKTRPARREGCRHGGAGEAALRCARPGVTIEHRGDGGELKIRYKTLEQLDEVIRRIERSD